VLDAQTAHFDGLVLGSGFNGPAGVAVDSIGDVFVADQVNNAIKEIVAINGVLSSQSQILTLGSGFNQPQDLVVDSAGNVFVADYGNNKVKEIVAPGFTTVLTLGGSYSLLRPAGVALDSIGTSSSPTKTPPPYRRLRRPATPRSPRWEADSPVRLVWRWTRSETSSSPSGTIPVR
jgi:hypothetical protein